MVLWSSSSSDSHTIPPTQFIDNVIFNHRSLDHIKSTGSCITGALAGVLGLTNHHGFILYLLSSVLISVIISISITLGRLFPSLRHTSTSGPSEPVYFQSRATLWTSGLVDNLFSYVLWWTLFYGLIHSGHMQATFIHYFSSTLTFGHLFFPSSLRLGPSGAPFSPAFYSYRHSSWQGPIKKINPQFEGVFLGQHAVTEARDI